MTIMIVTVIIMMPNDICQNIVSSIISFIGGISSGLIASIIFQKRKSKIERTRISISPEIARQYVVTGDGVTVVEYRTKISNETPQDAYDVRGYIRIRYKKKYLTIKLTSTPILHGNNGIYQEYDFQRVFPFRLTSLKLDTIKGTDDYKIIRLFKSKKLELHHFKDEDTIMEIVIMSVDSISGGVSDVQVMTFNFNEFETKIKTGEYDEKTLKVNTWKNKTPEER